MTIKKYTTYFTIIIININLYVARTNDKHVFAASGVPRRAFPAILCLPPQMCVCLNSSLLSNVCLYHPFLSLLTLITFTTITLIRNVAIKNSMMQEGIKTECEVRRAHSIYRSEKRDTKFDSVC